MCGNIWEHVGGVRFMDGMPQVIPNNGAAYGADQSKDSTEWEAIYTEDGDPVYYNVHGGEITLQPVHPDGTDYDGVKFTDLEVRSDMDVPDKLKDLGLYPADGYESDEYFWLDSDRCQFNDLAAFSFEPGCLSVKKYDCFVFREYVPEFIHGRSPPF